MARSVQAQASTATPTPSQVFYQPVADSSNNRNGTESTNQRTVTKAGIYSGLYRHVSANTITAPTAVVTRKGGADAAESILVPPSTTGEFSDTSNLDPAAVNELWGQKYTVGSTGTSMVFRHTQNLFAAAVGTVQTINTGSSTYPIVSLFADIGSSLASFSLGGTEGPLQRALYVSGTMVDWNVNVNSNTRTDTTTLNSRIGGANGALTISITTTTTGHQRDTSNIDSVASGTLFNYASTLGAGSGNIGCVTFIDYVTLNSIAQWIVGSSNNQPYNASTTSYQNIHGEGSGGGTPSTTESEAQQQAGVNAILSNGSVTLNSNTVSETSTAKLRVNSANGAAAISFVSNTSGEFHDISNVDVVVSSSQIDYQLVTGASGTSLTSIMSSWTATLSSPTAFLIATAFDIGRWPARVVGY